MDALHRVQGTEAAQARTDQRKVRHQPQAQRFKTAVCFYRDVYGLGQIYKSGYRMFTALKDGHSTNRKHKLEPCENACPSPLPKGSCFQKEGLKMVRSVDASPAKPPLQNDLEGEGWHCSGKCWASLLQIKVLAAPPTAWLAAAGEKGLSSIKVLSQSPRLPPH